VCGAGRTTGRIPEPLPPEGLYVHVPFCVSLCPYCDFVVYTGRSARRPGGRVGALVEALHVELDLRADTLEARGGGVSSATRPSLGSVYLGGGTPSLLPAAEVAALLDHVARRYGMAPDVEITLEANPGPSELGDLAGFRAAGVTRLSLGAQAMDAAALRRIGRRHRPSDVREAVSLARQAGFRSIGLDLLTDLPGQTEDGWRETLRGALDLGPDHLSVYALTLDGPGVEGSSGPDADHLPLRPGARRWRERARAEQDDERAATMEGITDALAETVGLERYEIANLARPGHASRHNLVYWKRRAWDALGPGAHAFDGRLERRWTTARLDRYLAALVPPDAPARLPPGGRETLTEDQAVAEEAMLGLRLLEGISTPLAVHPLVAPALGWAMRSGLAEPMPGREQEGGVRLTARGRLLADEVFVRLTPRSPTADGPMPRAPATPGSVRLGDRT
jgi:oxygen-independent coproporphyrinogen III oxidase